MTAPPVAPVQWVATNWRDPKSNVVVLTERLWFAARAEATRQLGAPAERVLLRVVVEAESVDAARGRVRAEAAQMRAAALAVDSAEKMGAAGERGRVGGS